MGINYTGVRVLDELIFNITTIFKVNLLCRANKTNEEFHDFLFEKLKELITIFKDSIDNLSDDQILFVKSFLKECESIEEISLISICLLQILEIKELSNESAKLGI